MLSRFLLLLLLLGAVSRGYLFSQIIINEGSNKSYLTGIDEDGEGSDWIELYNNSDVPADLSGYFLSDKVSEPTLWSLTDFTLEPHAFTTIYCSEKDRHHTTPFTLAIDETDFIPEVGWNTHYFTTAYDWDGVSNLIFNICSYNNTGYTENSVFQQTATPYASTSATFVDGSDASCSNVLGTLYFQRPNLQINGITIDFGSILNSNVDYPAPYGNWYWSARHQILVRAEELIAAGLSAGPISSLAFQLASTNVITYTYIDIAINSTSEDALSESMIPVNGYADHTNFKIDADGENIYLNDATGSLVSSLMVNSPIADISVGRSPDGTEDIVWMTPSPGMTNNAANVFTDTLISPVLSVPTSIVDDAFNLIITNPNTGAVATRVVYTLDGSEPTFTSTIYTGTPIPINENIVVRARVFPETDATYLPSYDAIATYLFGVNHSTPILLVTTDNINLYGATGIFDNYNSDWIKAAHAAYLSKEIGHPILFETRTAMRMDGGAGGSRANPQHSFRLSFDHAALGEKTIHEQLIPAIPFRNDYSDVYLRNGSNQWLTLPYKDACQVSLMSNGTNNYYSAMEPVSVYINGSYFGLYELREKFNTEYFDEREDINEDSTEILSLSYFYNLLLRALEGDVDNFYADYNAFNALNPMDTDYIDQADIYFDLEHYTDYIIGESWMGNTDWPYNNIKIYRSDKTNWRWRFALIDLELSLMPNSWTNCSYNHIAYMLSQGTDNPYINIWLQSIQNETYLNQFINRFADLMNTAYLIDTLLAGEQAIYDKWAPEMPNEYARWGDPLNVEGQMADFTARHETFRQQLECRSDKVRGDLLSEFDLTKEVTVHLDVYPELAGTIHLNTIEPGVYPWTGIYFDGVPITLTAQADSGYIFSYWEPSAFIIDTLNAHFTSNISDAEVTFTAVFKQPEEPDGTTIQFNVYPSPSNGSITIAHNNATLAKDATYSIYNETGQFVMNGNLSESALTTTLNVTHLAPAIYYVRINRGGDILQSLSFVRL
ncbi:MAG TPA: CotH kinase family protein [Chitinophagales bacterium]|nr:CotH kinase family protein [Chitinophagales bacterium]